MPDEIDLEKLILDLVRLIDSGGRPIVNPLSTRLRDINNLALNIKFFGYELARNLAGALPPRALTQPLRVGLKSKASTQADLESDWLAWWCAELKTAQIFHRKLWELSFVLQAIFEHGGLRDGAQGLGFGCGEEPIGSYLAAQGIRVTLTDLPAADREAAGWAAAGEHASSRDGAFKPHLVSQCDFERNVEFRHADMNAIPNDLRDYDFCWSICALEHLGSIRQGLDFIENSLESLQPGGLAVHTTEFNFTNDLETTDNWPTVLFQRKHFQEISSRLTAHGHSVAQLDFDVGSKPLDRFIDLPPYGADWPEHLREQWVGGPDTHIKLSVDGFPSTCFGLIVVKKA